MPHNPTREDAMKTVAETIGLKGTPGGAPPE